MRTLSLVASETLNGVLIHSPDGKVVWANDGFTRITGYTADEIIGHEPWVIVGDEHTNMKLVEMTYEKVSQGKPFSSDNILRHKNGTSVWVHTTFTPIKDDSGKISKVISIGTDITKQKELEELQRITLKRLQKRNKELSEKKGA